MKGTWYCTYVEGTRRKLHGNNYRNPKAAAIRYFYMHQLLGCFEDGGIMKVATLAQKWSCTVLSGVVEYPVIRRLFNPVTHIE